MAAHTLHSFIVGFRLLTFLSQYQSLTKRVTKMNPAKTIVFTGIMFLFLSGGNPFHNLLGSSFPDGSFGMALAGEQTENSNANNVQPWNSFRGWSPRVPYGQSNGHSTTPQSGEKAKTEESKNSTTDNLKPVESENKTSSDVIKNDVKPWESFRGWSREVPYSRNY